MTYRITFIMNQLILMNQLKQINQLMHPPETQPQKPVDLNLYANRQLKSSKN